MDKKLTISISRRSLKIALILAVVMTVLAPVAVIAAGGTFTDDDDSIFEANIEWLAGAGVTAGCNPPTNDNFCPDDNVSRGQMAAFMQRFAQFLGAEDGIVSNADHAATADAATSATNADNANTVDGKSAINFQPATIDFESADNVAVNSNDLFPVASGTVATTDGSGFFCLIGSVPRADVLISASGYVTSLVGTDATLFLQDAGGSISGTTRKVATATGSFAMEWMYETVGGTDTFNLVANEGGGDTYTVVDAVITVEVISDTRCKGNPIIVFPGEPTSSNDPDL